MNINRTFLAADGHTEIYTFGGVNALATYQYRGYVVSLEWFVGNKSSEPMMVIQCARCLGTELGAFGICLSSIGKYADASGNAAPGALAACFEALSVLGRAKLTVEAHLLLDVILNFTEALVVMPPTPREVRLTEAAPPILDVKHLSNGKLMEEASI